MLIIVESPNKTRQIQSYLGKGYEVIATMGHFRDLPKKHPGNLPEKWEAIKGKKGIITTLKKAKSRNPDGVVIATDPDREGEGIGWHVCDVLSLDPAKTPRAIFHEVTPSAVNRAVREALLPDGTRLNQGMVCAQKARRLIDRRIGYSGTRFLWKTVGGGVSAGRCIIPAAVLLKDINHREDLAGKHIVIRGELITNLGVFRISETLGFETEVTKDVLRQYVPEDMVVASVNVSAMRRDPPRPLDTASAMGAAGMSPSVVMKTLQSLFEKGYITYHRTTSRNISDTFRTALGISDKNTTGKHSPTTSSGDAHEAIRPTGSTIRNPEDTAGLDDTERRVYRIVWKHAVGSYYPAWAGEVMRISLTRGWQRRCERSTDAASSDWMTATGCAPPSKYPEDIKNTSTGQSVEVISGWIRASTENAGRGVTESGMVRVLKEAGIGRPSTYSTIISNLSKRGLAGFLPKKNTNIAEIRIGDTCHAEELDAPKSSRQNASFRVTETGDACIRELYNSGLEPFFKVSYTSEMETALDDVAEDKPGTDWKIIVSEVDYQIKEVENNTTIPVTKRGGAFVETILGTKGGWIYGKGRTRYGPVVWKQPEHETKRSYKKVSAKRWHMIELYHAVEML